MVGRNGLVSIRTTAPTGATIRGPNSDELLREDAVLQVWGCRDCQGPLPGAGAGGGSVLACSSELAVLSGSEVSPHHPGLY